jgi:hypothetical protein
VARREKYKNMPREERLAIAEKARKTRRANRLLRAQIRKAEPKPKKRRGARHGRALCRPRPLPHAAPWAPPARPPNKDRTADDD